MDDTGDVGECRLPDGMDGNSCLQTQGSVKVLETRIEYMNRIESGLNQRTRRRERKTRSGPR